MPQSISWFLSCLAITPVITSVLGSSPAGLALDFHVRRDQDSTLGVRKRSQDGIYSTDLSNRQQVGYYANVTIGNPPQPFTLHIDTGSSDTWVPAMNSTLCQTNQAACRLTGQYDISKSSTASLTNQNFTIGYGDNSFEICTFFEDTLTIAGATVESQRIGLSQRTLNPVPAPDDVYATGILGLGFDLGEQLVHTKHQQPYPTVVDELQSKGYIETRAYSIWLNGADAATGSILFGAVDETKYQGPLKTAPIVQSPNSLDVVRTAIQLTSLTLEDKSGNSSLIPDGSVVWATLDTGASICEAPAEIVDPIYAAAGVLQDNSTRGFPLIPCNMSTADANFTFGFGGPQGPQISVSIKDFVQPLPYNVTFQDGSPACVFGVRSSPDPMLLLGDTFLRSAYAVFDLSNNQIALAQSQTDTANSLNQSILPITKGKDGIPGVVTRVSSILWPQPYSTSYNAYWASQTAAAKSGKPTLTSSTANAAAAATTTGLIVPELPPKASFTAEGPGLIRIGNVTVNSTGSPARPTVQPANANAGIKDVGVGAGVAAFVFAMAVLATL